MERYGCIFISGHGKMYKPGLMKDVTKAAEILMDAIKNNVKIRVIGDYDVDGVMSSYILYRGIVMLGEKSHAVFRTE